MSLWNSKYAVLVRRELWEHRILWLAPAAVALLIVVLPMFGGNLNIGPSGRPDATTPGVPPQMQPFLSTMLLTGLAGVLGVVACIVSLVYLLDCLFAERKDRSILFWKSLPVSDAETVLAKLGLALVVVPLLTLAMAVLC
jgi:ABC-2 type transport system permease protein